MMRGQWRRRLRNWLISRQRTDVVVSNSLALTKLFRYLAALKDLKAFIVSVRIHGRILLGMGFLSCSLGRFLMRGPMPARVAAFFHSCYNSWMIRERCSCTVGMSSIGPQKEDEQESRALYSIRQPPLRHHQRDPALSLRSCAPEYYYDFTVLTHRIRMPRWVVT